MVLEEVGKQIKKVRDLYNDNDTFRIGVNTVGLYALVKGIVKPVATYFAPGTAQEIELVCDAAAPIIAGGYLLHEINHPAEKLTTKEGVKDLLTIITAAAIGWDMADTVVDFMSDPAATESVKNAYIQMTEWFKDKKLGPEGTGIVAGGVSGVGYKLLKGFNS